MCLVFNEETKRSDNRANLLDGFLADLRHKNNRKCEIINEKKRNINCDIVQIKKKKVLQHLCKKTNSA